MRSEEVSAQEENANQSKPKQFRLLDHDSTFKHYGASTALVADIQDQILSAKKHMQVWLILILSLFEYRGAEFLGTDFVLETWLTLASRLAPGYENVIFPLLMVLRFWIPQWLLENTVEFWSRSSVFPGYRPIQEREKWIEKSFALLSQEDQLNQNVLRDHFLELKKGSFPDSINRKTLKSLLIRELQSVELYQRISANLNGFRSIKGMISIFALILGISFIKHPRRALGSFILTVFISTIKYFYQEYHQRNLNEKLDSSLFLLEKLFLSNEIKVKSAFQNTNPSRRKLNFYSLSGWSDALDVRKLIQFMLRNEAIFSILAITRQGVIFRIVDITELTRLERMEFQFPKLEKPAKKIKKRQKDKATTQPVFLGPFENSNNDDIELRRKNPQRVKKLNHKAVDLTPQYFKRKAEKKSDSGMSYPLAPPAKSEYTPKWIVDFKVAIEEIRQANKDRVFIFVDGSAMEDFRCQRETRQGEDIDLLIVIRPGGPFILPQNFKMISEFVKEATSSRSRKDKMNNEQVEIYNFACYFLEIKFDISLQRGSESDLIRILKAFKYGNDFSHSRHLMPQDEGINIIRSSHSEECSREYILSARPRGAKHVISDDPYVIFRALSLILLGYFKVDQDMYEALKDISFCLNSIEKKEISHLRIFYGINRLFKKGHPVLAAYLLNQFSWLERFFEMRNDEALSWRLSYVHSKLRDVWLKGDLVTIYAILLWPSFSKDAFFEQYNNHCDRAKAFFALKDKHNGILFPGDQKKRPVNSSDILFFTEEQKATPDPYSLQIRISLLLYWLSLEFKGIKNDRTVFHPDLEKQYFLVKEILLDAFRLPSQAVDIRALIKANIYLNRVVPEKVLDYKTVGEVRNYFN